MIDAFVLGGGGECWCLFVAVVISSNPILPLFTSQDSSSVIQFVTRARVLVDPDLRVVEIPSGSPEEKPVSKS